MKKRVLKISIPLIIAGILIVSMLIFGVQAQDGAAKPYAEGEAGQTANAVTNQATQTLKPGEGIAGSSGSAHLDTANEELAVAGLSVLYRFTGVTDDGEQGSTNRKEATSIHCTNISATNTQVEVQLFQWNGTDIFTGTVNMPTNRSFTFSTQNTTIYFDDVLLGGSPGTPAIFQGSGRVLSSNPNVICTAQVLDPLNYPPLFVSGIDLFRQ
ncbi:MAG: hypothetical protein H6657_00930 [Ardenticatenaceae bacterium]|nr:hypothetical protein [Anaerolineales bacterium]MCB8975976.1 hypothetical protein [Ardenticatenaceae bacterium]